MFKSTLFVTLFLLVGFLASSSAASIPPACVLACVNEEPIPADLEAVCGSSDAQSCLAFKCGNYRESAVEFFRSTCGSAGHQVAEVVENITSSSSGSASRTSSGFATMTNSVDTTSTASGSNGPSASASGSAGSSTGTGVQEQNGNSAASNVAFGGPLAIVIVSVCLFIL